MINCIKMFVKNERLSQETADELLGYINKGDTGESAISRTKATFQKKIDNHPEATKKINKIDEHIKKNTDRTPTQHIKARLAAEPGKGNVFNNVEDLSTSYINDIFGKHFKTLNSFKNKLFGNKMRKDLIRDMVRVQFKEIDGVDASATLKEFNEVNEAMHQHYVNSGGTAPIKNITLSNNAERILQDDMTTFVDYTAGKVNNSRAEVEALYNKAHRGEEIEDDILDFKGSEDYLQYAGKYGNDMYSSLISSIKQKATKTAINQIFGSSPGAIQKLIKANKLNVSEQREVENLVNQLLGETNRNIATGKMATFSKWTKGARMLAAASQLGSAVLSAVSDLATVLVTANFNGMPVVKTFMQSLSGLGKSEKNSQILAQNGFISDNLIDDLAGATRMDVHAGTDVMSIATDKVLRASGLMAWTTAIKNAWKTSHLGFLATLPKDIKSMDKNVKKQFETYGITQDMWDNVYTSKDTNFINLTKVDVDTAHTMRKYINGETNYAILEPNALVGAIMTQGYQSGTAAGEAIRIGGQYKSFLVAGVVTHVARVLKLDTHTEKAAYVAKMVVAGTTIGMLVQALKDGKDGLDPTSRDYTDPQQYINALAMSGIGGIAFETLAKGFKGENPLKEIGLAMAPAAGIVKNLTSIVGEGYDVIATDKQVEDAFSDALHTTGKMIPGRNLLYGQWLTNEMGRNLLLLQNPGYQKAFDRIDRAKKMREKKDGLEEINYFE